MQLKDIKRLYRLYMNGIVSQSMRLKGAEYRVNFGLTLPLLRRIAEQVSPSVEIAEQLWQDRGVRESMLLAPMLFPVEQCKPADAQRWVEDIPNVEVADFCCKFLFLQLSYAPQLVLQWIVSPDPMVAYVGFRLSYALLSNDVDESWLGQIADVAIVAAYNNNALSASAARRFLTETLLRNKAGRVVIEHLRASEIIDDEWRENLVTLYDAE